ncbi:myosin light chain kinase, smooth muscle [Xenopus tropicalis]|uniref:Myosin light chain kinase, smooth muscle n=1 Tax=Xenopus tropicalis TaxID=8364 RepID=A0A6I8RNL8_XENTR|nr:myosin light chain kinase, smooth muscle [Xenopus tropicalis]
MSYTSTLRIQLDKPLLRDTDRGDSCQTENGTGSPYYKERLSAKEGEDEKSIGESKQPGALHVQTVRKEGRCAAGTQTERRKVTSVEMFSSRAVTTSDRFLTLILELSPQNGSGLYVRRVLRPDTTLTVLSTARENKTPMREESTHVGKTNPMPLSATTVPKESSSTQPSAPPSRFESPSTSITHGPVSPKRKPNKTGDSLKIVDGVDQIKARVGDKVELHCGIQGTTPIAATWLRNKKQVTEGPRISVHTSDMESRLVIDQVCEDDSGCYTLYVQDRTGNVQHHTSLTVVEHPSPPSGKPLVSATQPSSLTLSWSGPCYDGGSAVVSYWIEMKCTKKEEDGWKLLTDSCVNTSYRVEEGLQPGGQYQFRVRAANAHGVSEPGEESDIVAMLCAGDEETEGEGSNGYTNVSVNTTEHFNDFYIQLEKLGMGKFGQVYKLKERSTGKICAGKFFKARTQKEIQGARVEVELMNKLHHPQLVRCLSAFQEPGRVVMVLEYIAGGELFERIVADDFEHTEVMCVEYICQILNGVAYMHHQSIVHLDLKPENIICLNTVSNQVKIIDFGLARELDPHVPMKVLQGTAEFVAPEVIAFEPVGFTTDMWSLGVICYILLSGDSPFQGNNDMETMQNITSACWDFDDETNALLSETAKDFVKRLLQKNMRSRLTAVQALDHPWVQHKCVSKTKTLSKERIKKFLARQKWQKTGKAVLALNRMALLSAKSDNNTTSTHTDGSHDCQQVSMHLQEQLQAAPVFSTLLKDQVEVVGSTARFQCHIEGFPDPEVLWFHAGSPVQECRRLQIEYEDTGSCALIISDVLLTDSGVYTCRASNTQGEIESSAKLTVHSLLAERRAKESTQ